MVTPTPLPTTHGPDVLQAVWAIERQAPQTNWRKVLQPLGSFRLWSYSPFWRCLSCFCCSLALYCACALTGEISTTSSIVFVETAAKAWAWATAVDGCHIWTAVISGNIDLTASPFRIFTAIVKVRECEWDLIFQQGFLSRMAHCVPYRMKLVIFLYIEIRCRAKIFSQSGDRTLSAVICLFRFISMILVWFS